MPKRVIDFDAMWGSDKLASCAEWAQAEYAWLYGLADASGCFEVTNLRVIWGRVAAIRHNLTIERLEQIFDEFQDKGLLFVWEHEGKRYGHWTGSDVPGRLPPPSWRMRLERLAPPVPKQQFAEYVSHFARGRASLPGGGFRAQPVESAPVNRFENSNLNFESSNASWSQGNGSYLTAGATGEGLRPFKRGIEEAQAEDWNLDLGKKRKVGREEGLYAAEHAAAGGEVAEPRTENSNSPHLEINLNSNATANSDANSNAESQTNPLLGSNSKIEGEQRSSHRSQLDSGRMASSVAAGSAHALPAYPVRDKSILVARELIVGRGPACGPVKVKPEALERIRAREAARNGSRSP